MTRAKPLQTQVEELGTYGPDELVEDLEHSVEIDPLSDESLAALRRLARYRPPPDPYPFPEGRAAVMVALFGSRSGEQLNVLLSTRSAELRTYPGNVALPGGKVDPEDINSEATARREALEEVGLPDNPNQVRYLTSLRPFLARSLVLVTPIVCFILDSSIRPTLNPTEVSSIFSIPLSAFLASTPPPSLHSRLPPDVVAGTKPYHIHADYAWYGGLPQRYHEFHVNPKPVIGFSAEILVECARIAYGREPEFENLAPGQLRPERIVELALKDDLWAQKRREEREREEGRRLARLALVEKVEKL